MKIKKWYLIAALVLAVMFIGSCDLFNLALSASDRLDNFASDLNSSIRLENELKGNFSSAAQQYPQMDIDYFNNAFPTANTYSFTNINTSSSTITATLVVTFGGSSTNWPVSVTMDTEGDGNHLIRTFSGYGLSIYNIK